MFLLQMSLSFLLVFLFNFEMRNKYRHLRHKKSQLESKFCTFHLFRKKKINYLHVLLFNLKGVFILKGNSI